MYCTVLYCTSSETAAPPPSALSAAPVARGKEIRKGVDESDAESCIRDGGPVCCIHLKYVQVVNDVVGCKKCSLVRVSFLSFFDEMGITLL